MAKPPSITEQQLSRLRPNRLDEDFFERLSACAEGTFSEITDDEKAFEELLRDCSPKAVSAQLNSNLLAAIGDAPFSVDEKIVLFNRGEAESSQKAAPKRFKLFRNNYAAAAAVALLGGMAALMIPTGTQGGKNITERSSEGSAIPSPVATKFVPASFNRNLSDTQDEGVIWRGKNIPHRVLRLTYTDRFTLEDKEGSVVEVEQPSDEFVIIPEKMD
ncbi:MAG: hypothetical protein AB8D78_08380 [Akkermansiaceae bacterium]